MQAFPLGLYIDSDERMHRPNWLPSVQKRARARSGETVFAFFGVQRRELFLHGYMA